MNELNNNGFETDENNTNMEGNNTSATKFCSHCGKKIHVDAQICPYCGCRVNGPSINKTGNPNDSGSIGYAILGFFIPLVGLILFLVWKDNQPRNAKSAGKGALFGVLAYVLIYVLIFVCAVVSSSLTNS